MNSQATPLVTIGMPVRNGGALFRDALGSVVAQDYPNLEIVISDNASTDQTPEIISEFQARDPRIVLIRHEVMLPVMDNFTCVLNVAKGDFFAWAAHDDTRSVDFVSGLLTAFRDPDVVLAFPDLVIKAAPHENGALRAYDFDNSGMSPLGRLRKQVKMQCFHIYGLWRTNTLRSTQWHYTPWWPDMPLMTTVAYQGVFRYVKGPKFIYLEISKTNAERAAVSRAQPQSRLRNVIGLAHACWKTALANIGFVPALVVYVSVLEKYGRIFISRILCTVRKVQVRDAI